MAPRLVRFANLPIRATFKTPAPHAPVAWLPGQ
jgi:hypothetical protein